MAAPLLEIKNVSRRYESADAGKPLVVLDAISLTVEAGDSVAIVGPSGSGKSTLLQIIGTLDRASGGEVLLGGKNLTGLDELALASTRNLQIGFVFQSHFLLPQCTVCENVFVPTLALKKSGDKKSEPVEKRAARLLDRVGLSGRKNHRPGELSGGERQRVAVARALINNPRLLLADEPTGALDQANAESLGKLLLELNREEQVTIIVVTHSMELARQMRRVFELKNGKLSALSLAGTM